MNLELVNKEIEIQTINGYLQNSSLSSSKYILTIFVLNIRIYSYLQWLACNYIVYVRLGHP